MQFQRQISINPSKLISKQQQFIIKQIVLYKSFFLHAQIICVKILFLRQKQINLIRFLIIINYHTKNDTYYLLMIEQQKLPDFLFECQQTPQSYNILMNLTRVVQVYLLRKLYYLFKHISKKLMIRFVIVLVVLELAIGSIISSIAKLAFPKPIHNHLYVISYSGWGRKGCLDEHGGGEAQAYPCNGGDYQKWWLKDAGDGYFYIKSYRSGNVLDSNHNGDAYTLPANGGHFQHWKINMKGLTGRFINRATQRQLYRGTWTDTVKTVKKDDGDLWELKDITPSFTCPQMNNYIGNSNGVLTFGKQFSATCQNIEFWRSANGVTVRAQCWTSDRKQSLWSTMTWNAFYECL